MDSLSLYFGHHKLYRVEFEHRQLSHPIVSIRGKTPRALGTITNFQWTAAVQALAALVLKAAIAKSCDDEKTDPIALEGERHSLAASLDYALGKKPLWLREMFGTGKSKKLLSQLLFVRTNPEQRIPGPVAVIVRPQVWDSMNVKIYEDGKLLESTNELSCLLERLLPAAIPQNISTDQPSTSETPAPVYQQLREILRPAYHAELYRSLVAIDPLNEHCLMQCVKSFTANPSTTRRVGKKVSEFSSLLRSRNASVRLGLGGHQKELLDSISQLGEITVAAPLVFLGSLAIFTYLKHWRGLPLRILDHFPHAVLLSAQLARGEFSQLPDLATMGVGPGITIMNSFVGDEYAPFVLLPQGRLSILRARNASDTPVKNYSLLNDEPSSPLFLLENLQRDFGYRGDASHDEPDQSLRRLAAGDPADAAILMFPFNYLARKVSGAEQLEAPKGSVNADYILYASRRVTSLPKISQALEILIRDAWIELISNAQLRSAVIEKLLSNEGHMRTISRSSGLIGEISKYPSAA